MSAAVTAILDWQRRFREQPRVWTVFCDGETTGNVYATREGADIEVAWLRARGHRRARVESMGNIHSDELSRERWR